MTKRVQINKKVFRPKDVAQLRDLMIKHRKRYKYVAYIHPSTKKEMLIVPSKYSTKWWNAASTADIKRVSMSVVSAR